MNIVKIEWEDARSIDGWCEEKDLEEKLSFIKTCGYLVKENLDSFYVSACVYSNDDDKEKSFACTIVIPRKMVISYKELDIK